MLAVCSIATAQPVPVPAHPSSLEARLKSAYVSYIKAKAAGNDAAQEINGFFVSHPGLDMRFPDAAEYQASFARPGAPPLDLIRAYYDPRLEIIVVPRTGELEAVTGPDLPDAAALDRILRVRASDILHESFHAMLDKKFGFKLFNILEGELLANLKEAQYLLLEQSLTPDLAAVADEHFRIEGLRRARGGSDSAVQALESKEAASMDRLGADDVDNAIKVARLRRGPDFFKHDIVGLYGGAGQGMPSVFADRAQIETALRRQLARPGIKPAQRDVVLVELGFWSHPDRIETVRHYFREAIPDLVP